MIDICDKKNCCGCNACGDTCPSGAISFKRDDEGFLYPVVDRSKCIDCGLCEKVCPWIDTESRRLNKGEPRCYAAVHKNTAVRFASTSGGVFSALASAIYRQGGYVGGAVWDEGFSVRQFVSCEKIDLLRIRESKLTQSDARGFYKAVADALNTGKPVLACGTPCQMIALRSFLSVINVPTDKLYTVDFICCGVNSPLVFEEFLKWHEKQSGSKVTKVRIKNKELGWRNLTVKLIFADGTVKYDTRETCLFTKGFVGTHQFCRPSCYECRCKGAPRFSDLTIGDYWGDPKALEYGMDGDIGTSVVFVNNEHGQRLFELCLGSMKVQELPFNTATDGNMMFFESLHMPDVDRAIFFAELNNGGFDAVVERIDATPIRRKRGLKGALRVLAKFGRRIKNMGIATFWRTLRYNRFFDLISGRPILIVAGPAIIECDGVMNLGGDLIIGKGFFQKALHVTAIAIRNGGELKTHGTSKIYYGADIEVFKGGRLEIGKGCFLNLNANIVCGSRITLRDGVSLGRNVTIRDNNGGHWTNMQGAKQTAPVEIGDHAWLCEGCTIMPGVKIGAGAIVGAKAVVFSNVPANTLVLGNPARVVSEGVEWKK